MQRAHDVVGRLDLVIYVLDARTIGREKSYRMVHLVNVKQGGVADAVADTSVAHSRPEGLVANRIGRAQADMTEAGDAGIARSMITGAADGRAPRDLDPVAGWIGEGDEVILGGYSVERFRDQSRKGLVFWA
jgi:hypothetical protein